VGLGFASHLLAGVMPFLASGVITRLGLMRGTATLYVAGSVLLLAAIGHQRLRRLVITETAALVAPATRRLFLLGLAGFLVAGVAYYVGLARSPRVAEYIFLTRLDWLVQAAVAIVWLREPWSARGVSGAGLALAGGLVLAWSGAFGLSGLAAAGVYILASLAGYSCFKPISMARGPAGAVALTVWRHWINTLGFVALAVGSPSVPAAGLSTGVLLATLAGVLLIVLFLLRFTALTRLPLWVLSAQAPTQALVAILVTSLTGGVLSTTTIVAIGLIVAGEMLVTSTRPTHVPASALGRS